MRTYEIYRRATELVFIQTMLDLILKYGVDGVIEVIKAWNVINPSIEDIEALRTSIKPPEEYFKEG